jgi:hypothetical protein
VPGTLSGPSFLQSGLHMHMHKNNQGVAPHIIEDLHVKQFIGGVQGQQVQANAQI